jgi:outer membrane protein OmpA-like peptidoglycan-associated protein
MRRAPLIASTSLLAFSLAAMLPGAARAQSNGNPSAEQIIKALKPTGTLPTTTRGIVPLAPGNGGGGAAAPSHKATSAAMQEPPAPAAAQQKAMPQTAMPQTAMPQKAMPQATQTQAGTQTQAARPPSVNLNVDFALGSAKLTAQAKRELDHLGQALTDPSLKPYRFKIVGHTDTTGAAAVNRTLSNARAKSVASYLEHNFGISGGRLDAYGVGESDLLVPTGPNVANRKNRRVQVINAGR